jgi:Na+:H+ antiporter, NhaA family
MNLLRKAAKAPGQALTAIIEHPLGAGIALLLATLAALAVANSPWLPAYEAILKTYAGGLSVGHWINDGLMAVFFLLVGLELKRELLEGELSSWSQRILPGIAASSGVLLPALIFIALNRGDAQALRGWAIPSATDIAFALGVLSLLGPRVPATLRLFLTTIAVLDDLAAILIIALFYTAGLSLPMLGLAAAALAVLVALNRSGVLALWPYFLAGLALWIFVLKSGVHATLAGVALAMTIPFATRGDRPSPLLHLEHALQPWVAFFILPVFAFANAGVSLAGFTVARLLEPLTLGIAAGLFFGKQTGIFATVWLAEKSGLAPRPEGANWTQVYGVALLCGIGFTMSLFIGLLAFPESPPMQDATKIGVLTGSLVSAVAGYAVLRFASNIQKLSSQS